MMTLEGKEYRLRPTFQSIMDIEERLGGILGLAVKAAEGNFGLKEMTVIIWATMEGQMTFDEVGKRLLSGGLVKASPVVKDLLTLCLVGSGKGDYGQD